MKTIKFLLVMFFSLAITACGGGGSSSPAGDITPPTVSSVNPTSNATGVALNAAITATFSEAMTASTINSTNFAVSGVPGTVTYSGTTATFTPSANLSPSTLYTATITTGVKDASGNALASAYVWTFTTGTTADTTPPTVTSTSPANTATNVAVNSAITATFSENMNASTITSANFTVAGVNGTVTYSGTTATFTPSNNLAYSTPYTATISTNVRDAAGNAMAAVKTWTFTTGPAPDTTPPTVSSTSPANGATGVGPNTLVTATFSESMDAATITNTTFTLNNSVTGTVTYSGTTATFTPSANLNFSTTYTATITTAVTDVAGNHMTANKTWTFTTGSQPTYTLSGTVTGPYVAGITITRSGTGTTTTTTDANGNYSFTNLPAGSYTVTPSLAGYTYSPSAPTVTITNANTTQNFTASSAIASHSISGTVSYAGGKSGPVYLRVWDTNCNGCGSPRAGTRITLTAGSGSYTVRGLQPGGNYVVNAEMDTLDTGVKNASNPAGNSTQITNISANLTGINITLADPAAPVPVTPTGLVAFPSSGAALIFWDPSYDVNGAEIATSYKIYWGTDTNASNLTPMTVAARDDGHRFQSGLTNGTSYYYKITALVGATESAPSAVVGPVTINATTGLNTVSGTVSFTGTATGPMLVGLFGNSGVYLTRIANPASPQSYSIAGVPNGSYFPFAIIDMNNNGVIDTGDISNTNGSGNQITVSGNTTSNIALSSASATTGVTTQHWSNGVNESYNLGLSVSDGTKRVVAVTLVSGLNVAVPFDMGKGWDFETWQWLNTTSPTVGDSYMFKITYSDGTTQNLTGSVTAVLGTANMAQSLTTVTNGTGGSSTTVPLFTWIAPSSPPASYIYYLYLWGSDAYWYYPRDNGLPSNTLSALYNADGNASKATLTPGTTYTWQVRVEDANGNTAVRESTYTP